MKLKNCVVGTKVKIKAWDKQQSGLGCASMPRYAGAVATIERIPDRDGDVKLHTVVDGYVDIVHHSNLKLIKGSK